MGGAGFDKKENSGQLEKTAETKSNNEIIGARVQCFLSV